MAASNDDEVTAPHFASQHQSSHSNGAHFSKPQRSSFFGNSLWAIDKIAETVDRRILRNEDVPINDDTQLTQSAKTRLHPAAVSLTRAILYFSGSACEINKSAQMQQHQFLLVIQSWAWNLSKSAGHSVLLPTATTFQLGPSALECCLTIRSDFQISNTLNTLDKHQQHETQSNLT